MSDTFRIAVVDDDDAVREGALIVLENEAREVEGYVAGEPFLDAAQTRRWDLAFVDLKMPGASGFDVLRRLTTEEGSLPFPVVMISAHGDIAAAVQAMRLGAFSFIEKPFTPEILEEAITEVREAGSGAESRREAVLAELTPREREVAELLEEGLSNKEVGLRLGCSPRTVEIHRARVFEKTGVRNVAGLVRALSRR